MSYYRKKVYDSHNGDSGLNARTGQVVEVLRELTEEEADIADVGRMFHVRFADGFETDVFEDELEVHDTVKIIVDGTNTFQVVDSVPLGYVIWNIGNNMADGYLPLCQVGGPDGCQVNPDTLKAVKVRWCADYSGRCNLRRYAPRNAEVPRQAPERGAGKLQ